VADLMVPADEDFFEAIPVSDKVNKVGNVGPDLLEPVEETLPQKEKKTGPDSGQMSLF
jgi:hypothetical protein